ncbi:NAD(P)H-dependent glycerol-3-phosphate dehydrogenase [Holospora undulata]|uniref:Glycerol-3-phosphate dehydrogenase n=1 Tax=Holospora undulata HU1 TaxID=1321371 RepID=A0A061JH87_9PROT|nr:NAD(P)H-dependent glycerol-3-phosphate dehydrogenase [Holospora undulata]ETZ04637.1 glycerol-3-phosphate dehydrogenase [NAD(P)+] [Holospora undulata HU1]
MSEGITFWGAGVFSAALASCICSEKSKNIFMWGRKNSSFHPTSSCYTSVLSVEKAAESGQVWIFCVPAQSLRSCFELIKKSTIIQPRIVVLTCKGIESSTGDLMTEVAEHFFPDLPNVVLGGPNFASGLARRDISGVTLATRCRWSFNEIFELFSKSCLRIEYFGSASAVSAWGALKNVAALGCGLLAQVSSGENTQSTYLCQIFSQAVEWISSHISKDESSGAWTYAGMGDFFMTCSSQNSRNFLYGKNFGTCFSLSDQLVEGLGSLKGILLRNKQYRLRLKFIEIIEKIFRGEIKKSDWLFNLLST